MTGVPLNRCPWQLQAILLIRQLSWDPPGLSPAPWLTALEIPGSSSKAPRDSGIASTAAKRAASSGARNTPTSLAPPGLAPVLRQAFRHSQTRTTTWSLRRSVITCLRSIGRGEVAEYLPAFDLSLVDCRRLKQTFLSARK